MIRVDDAMVLAMAVVGPVVQLAQIPELALDIDKLTSTGILAAVLIWAIRRLESLDAQRQADFKLVMEEILRTREVIAANTAVCERVIRATGEK